MVFKLSAVLALASLPQAFAHGGVLSYLIAGTKYQGVVPYNTLVGQTSIQRPWLTYNPILNATDPTIACNDDGTSLTLQLTAAGVPAGSSITAYWNQPWPHPYGPMLVYLAQCPGTTCTNVNPSTLKWFKIDQSGLINGTVFAGYWGDGKMIDQNSSWTTTIPASVPSGNYLIRFETIALHSLPAQFYPECAQIQITGGGSLAPTAAQLVSFPGGYSNTDPGLTIDIYSNDAQTQTTYPIPGPPLYGSSSVVTTTTGPTTTTKSTTTTTFTTKSTSSVGTTTTTKTTTSTQPVTSGVAEFGQCGGTGYTGSTTCVSPYKCTYSNDYYSQCL